MKNSIMAATASIALLTSTSLAHADTITTGDVQFLSSDELGDTAYVSRDADGTLEVNGGSTIDLFSGSDPDPIFSGPLMFIGRTSGFTGITTITGAGSAINLNADDDASSVQIGREGTGTLNVFNGGTLNVSDPSSTNGSESESGESLFVGRNGGNGELNIDNGSVTVDSGDGSFVFVGRAGGFGTINIDNGGILTARDRSTDPDDVGASIVIGHNGGNDFDLNLPIPATGELHVDNSVVRVESDNNGAFLSVGRDQNSSGNATIVNGGLVEVISGGNGGSNERAGVTIGRDDGSTGSMTVGGGSVLRVDSDNAFLVLGLLSGSNGSLDVVDGGRVEVLGDASSDIFVGIAAADFGFPEGGTGSLSVSGSNSSVHADGDVYVGETDSLGGGTSGGGVVSVSDGALLSAQSLVLGTGGVLRGSGGRVAANIIMEGGRLEPGSSPGVMDIDGDLEFLDGILELEVGGSGAGEFDVLNITGDFLSSITPNIVLSFIDGFAPSEGDTFDFLNVDGDSSVLESLTALDLTIQGLTPDAEFDVMFADGSFGAETIVGGTSTTSPVPVPAALPLLASALAGLGLLNFWKRRVKTRMA